MIIFAFFFVQSAPEYINIDNSSFLALDKSDHDGGTQWTCTENHFWSEKSWFCYCVWQRQKYVVGKVTNKKRP